MVSRGWFACQPVMPEHVAERGRIDLEIAREIVVRRRRWIGSGSVDDIDPVSGLTPMQANIAAAIAEGIARGREMGLVAGRAEGRTEGMCEALDVMQNRLDRIRAGDVSIIEEKDF